LREKYWWLVGLFREKSTVGWWVINQTNGLRIYKLHKHKSKLLVMITNIELPFQIIIRVTCLF
jgi:hypothetical protein